MNREEAHALASFFGDLGIQALPINRSDVWTVYLERYAVREWPTDAIDDLFYSEAHRAHPMAPAEKRA